MVSLKINDIKHFMSALLAGDTFDDFLVSEINISTYCNFNIDGHTNGAFFSDDDTDNTDIPALSQWRSLKSVCYDLIKGKKLPLKFKIIFFLPPPSVNKLLSGIDTTVTKENINGLCLNIKYENNALTCITGTSLNIFTTDKSLEKYFDDTIKTFLETNFDAEIL